MRVQHILLVGLFRSLTFELREMAAVHVHSCHVHMRGVCFISKQASSGGGKRLSYQIWNPQLFFSGFLYSKEMGLGNKAEVTFVAHCVMLWQRNPFIQFDSISFSFPSLFHV